MQYLNAHFGIQQPYVMVMSTSNWKTKNLSASLAAIEAARDLTKLPFQTVVTGSPVGLDQTGWRGRLRNAVETGFIDSADMQKLYRNAALFVTLSMYEGFGLQLAEGMASGTPCVVSDGGSLPEIAGDGAIVCPLSDPESATKAIVNLLQNDSYRKDLSQKALARAAVFSRERLAEGLLDLYAKIAKPSVPLTATTTN